MLDQESHKEIQILVVDDDQTLLKFFKIHLNKFFSKVIVVKNAKEAMDTLKEKPVDLVISDIRMPREDGIQLMRKIRTHDPSLPVFLISGAMLTVKQTDSIESKADGFLEKPFELEALHQFILRGIQTRLIYKELFALISEPRKFMSIVRGKSFPKIADAEIRDRARELRKQLIKLHEPSAKAS